MIIIGVTGSIAIYKSCYIVNELVKEGKDVTVVMTRQAKEFIKPLTFQALTGNKVVHDMFNKDIYLYDFPHVNLAGKAELIMVAPCTANLIAKIANGICDDTLSCLIMSSSCPVLIAPAMNEKMFMNKAVQENIKVLKSRGIEIIPPIKGRLACGYEGMGHLASEEIILKRIRGYVKS